MTLIPTPAPESDSSLFRSVFANASILLSGKAAGAVLGLGVAALAARALGIHAFGILILVHAFAEAVKDLAGFQSWQVVLHYGTHPMKEGNLPLFQRVLRFSLMLDLIGACAGVAIAVICVDLVGQQLGWPREASPAYLFYVTAIAFMASATPTGVLRLFDRFDLLAYQSTVTSLVRLVGAAIIYTTGGTLTSFLIVWYLAEVIAFCFLFGLAAKELHRHGCLRGFRRIQGALTQGLPGIWRFCWSTNFNMTLTLAFTHAGTLVVGWFLGPTDAALYRIARQVGAAIAKPAKLATPALYPELARLWASGSTQDLYRLALQVGLAAGAVASVLLFLVGFAGEFILGTVIGPDFIPAGPVMFWLVAASVISIWGLPLEPLLISTGRASTALSIRAAITLIYLPTLMFALHNVGLMGAGYAPVAAQIVMLGTQIFFVLRLRAAAPLNIPGPAH